MSEHANEGTKELTDRGDVIETPKEPPITEDEKKLAGGLKDGEKKAEVEEEEEKDDDKKKDTRIPVARHKAMLEAERSEKDRALAKLAQYENSEDLAKTNDHINKMEDARIKLEETYAKQITDGDPGEAAKTMREIRKLDNTISDLKTDLKTAAAESRAYERARYDTVVDRIEAAYDVLRPSTPEAPNPKFDGAKVSKVLSVARAYQGDGMTPAAALQEAVKDLLGEPETKEQVKAVEVTPRVDEAAAKKALRDEEARRKNTEAAGKQPPNTKDVGKDADKLGGSGTLSAADVLKMPYNDFSKLDEASLARLRGDTL